MRRLGTIIARAEKAQEGSKTRELTGSWAAACCWVGRAMSAYHVLVAAGLLLLVPVAHNSVHLGFALLLTFMLYPAAKQHRGRVTLVDVLWLALGLLAVGYTFYMQQFQQDTIIYRAGETTALELILGVVAIAVVLEASRRVMGWPLVIIAVAFLLYGHVSRYLPGPLHTAGFGFERIINHIFVSGNGIWGMVL
ncbi:MAG: hypothetical protein H5T92_06810, partial [Synergistales bacterium]|nr:hypothetical protein [Synergistales bacterium]